MEQPRVKQWDVGLGQQVGTALVGLALTYSAAPWAADAPDLRVIPKKSELREIALNLEPAIAPPIYKAHYLLSQNNTDDANVELLDHPQFATDDLEILRAGIGMDMSLTEIGNFHFNLYSPDGDLNKGKRWTLGMRDGQAPIVSRKIWSIGGKLEMMHDSPSGPKTIGFVPQLMFNFEDVGWVGGKMQVTLEYQHWGSGSADDTSRDMPQIQFRWSF